MKNIYTLSLAFLSVFTFAQQQETISFETSEGFQLGNNTQPKWLDCNGRKRWFYPKSDNHE